MDLVYLDPPFNSAQNYNVLFDEKDGTRRRQPDSRLRGHLALGRVGRARLRRSRSKQPAKSSDVMQAFYTFLGGNDMMAYLAMMAPRLVELRRVLKPTGSHLPPLRPDRHPLPQAAHGRGVWARSIPERDHLEDEQPHTAMQSALDPSHDTIFFYSRSRCVLWNRC